MSALDIQVGGGHYKDYLFQPVEFAILNNLSGTDKDVVKYVCRWRTKNGIEDLKKARHYIELRLEVFYEHRCDVGMLRDDVDPTMVRLFCRQLPADEAGIVALVTSKHQYAKTCVDDYREAMKMIDDLIIIAESEGITDKDYLSVFGPGCV